MKFGKVEDPSVVDFRLPSDHPETVIQLQSNQCIEALAVHVGFPTWNKEKLPNFYPRGTKNELEYYSKQFNSIEFNASYYRIFNPEQFAKWHHQTPEGFKFYPKLVQNISHWRKLKDCEALVDEFINSCSKLEFKLGTIFLQMHENFTPNSFDSLVRFLDYWPSAYPLAVELRNERWYSDRSVVENLHQLLQSHGVDAIITDTLGRRDMVHSRLTTSRAFVRFAAANHASDYKRLDAWIEKISNWKTLGLSEIAFFIHQNSEKENPMLATYFVEKLNAILKTELHVPHTL
ncbi:MAG: DUF72 domain-containing protein [Flavobacteriales bacterium]|nr:DUF72 domain-containing protein [Flavobacteriales bacterium]